MSVAADAPPEVIAAKNRHQIAVAAATKPLRDRYVQELQQLKSRAMSMKNLELAVAIDAEIKAATGGPGSAATPANDAAASRNEEDTKAIGPAKINGDFSQRSAKGGPEGWILNHGGELRQEDNNPFVHFDIEAGKGSQASFHRMIETPPNAKAVSVRLRARVQNYKLIGSVKPNLSFSFKNDSDARLGHAEVAIDRNTPWKSFAIPKTPFPKGVTKILLIVELPTVGSYDFDDVEVLFY